MEIKTALKPAFKVLYNGKDITEDISPWLMDATYTDKLTGESDEFDLTLANLDNRWLNAWYPDHGAELRFEYGHPGEALVSAGAFSIDEIELADTPATVRIRALAAGVTVQARTRKAKAYAETTLKDLVNKTARRLKAEVKGQLAHIPIPKVTQYGESDWAFLTRICREHGYTVKLTNNSKTLVVEKLHAPSHPKSSITFVPADLESWRYRDKVTDVPAKTTVRSRDPRKKQTVKADVAAKATQHSADQRLHHRPARSSAQAKAQAEASQARAETDKTTFEFTRIGDKRLAAGTVFTLAEFGRLSGTYRITEARQRISRGQGYKTTATAKRI